MLTTKTGAGLVSGSAPNSLEGATQKIKVIRGFVWEGRDIKPGDTVEVTEKFARQMIYQGKAETSPEPKKPKKGKKK